MIVFTPKNFFFFCPFRGSVTSIGICKKVLKMRWGLCFLYFVSFLPFSQYTISRDCGPGLQFPAFPDFSLIWPSFLPISLWPPGDEGAHAFLGNIKLVSSEGLSLLQVLHSRGIFKGN